MPMTADFTPKSKTLFGKMDRFSEFLPLLGFLTLNVFFKEQTSTNIASFGLSESKV